MKIMASLVLLGAALFMVAPTAHAWAMYNHLDYEMCLKSNWSFGMCKYKVGPHDKYSGGHGQGLKEVYAAWIDNNFKCYESHSFDIPDGGYIKVYPDVVKIYHHDDKEKGTVSVWKHNCN